LFKVVLHKPTKSVNFDVFDGITIFFSISLTLQ
jgi:hypothetical protein